MNVLSLSICLLFLLCSQYTLNLLTDFHFNRKQRFRGYEISWMLVEATQCSYSSTFVGDFPNTIWGRPEVWQVLGYRNSKGPGSAVLQGSWEGTKRRIEWKARNMRTKIVVKKAELLSLFTEMFDEQSVISKKLHTLV